MSKEEKLDVVNKATEQKLTMEYIEQGAKEYEITIDEMLDLMLESVEENL